MLNTPDEGQNHPSWLSNKEMIQGLAGDGCPELRNMHPAQDTAPNFTETHLKVPFLHSGNTSTASFLVGSPTVETTPSFIPNTSIQRVSKPFFDFSFSPMTGGGSELTHFVYTLRLASTRSKESILAPPQS